MRYQFRVLLFLFFDLLPSGPMLGGLLRGHFRHPASQDLPDFVTMVSKSEETYLWSCRCVSETP